MSVWKPALTLQVVTQSSASKCCPLVNFYWFVSSFYKPVTFEKVVHLGAILHFTPKYTVSHTPDLQNG